MRAGLAFREHECGGSAEFDEAAVDLALQFPHLLDRRSGKE